MGKALCKLGNYEASLSFSKEAMSEFEEMGDVEGVACALMNIKVAQSGLKQFDEALGSFELALNLNPHSVLKCEITNLIGSVYLYKVLYMIVITMAPMHYSKSVRNILSNQEILLLRSIESGEF